MQIKKFYIQVLGRVICSKSTFLNESALSRLGHWWLIFNHCKSAHFLFLCNLYWVKFLLYVKKGLSLASRKSQFFNLLTNWIIRLLLLGGDIYPNPGPQFVDLSITGHQISFLCNCTKQWVHLKCSQITTKDYNNSWYCTLYSTFNHKTQKNTTSSKSFFNLLQLNANGIHNKTNKI